MADHHRHRNGPLGPFVPFPDVQIGAADAGLRNLDENIVGPDLRHRLVPHDETFRPLRFDQRLHDQITPNSRPTSVNAATAASISSAECAADIWVRMRAWPGGTTG